MRAAIALRRGDESFTAAARRADDSLDRARELGRNRTELARAG
jgi:PleD family two-component response regulator